MASGYQDSTAIRYRPRFDELEKRIVLDDSSASYFGVNARLLTTPSGQVLTGYLVRIGQVEQTRAVDPTIDTISHSDVHPIGSFLIDQQASGLTHLVDAIDRNHATGVASIMIASGTTNRGIAPRALLRTTSFSTPELVETNSILAAQYLSVGARAINYSFNPGPASGSGVSLLSLGLDWLSQTRGLLNVISRGNVTSHGDAPGDSYNGIVVGLTRPNADGVFSNRPALNRMTRDTNNDREYTDIVAPGLGFDMAKINDDGSQGYGPANGTSFAAPHVTGAVALLQEFGDAQRMAGVAGWEARIYRDPKVMKVVLMNSADKVTDTWGGLGLDMEKTIIRSDGKLWGGFNPGNAVSNDPFVPLDNELGSGQLNVRRALNQFSSGASARDASGRVGVIGWDAGSISAVNPEGDEIRKYVLSQPLAANSNFSVTLTWNRPVTLVNTPWVEWFSGVNPPGVFDRGDTFQAGTLSNLDLYLMPRGAANINQAVGSSRSTQYNVEQIFTTVASAGNYEVWVVRRGRALQPAVDYALAWWGVTQSYPFYDGQISGVAWAESGVANGRRDDGETLSAGVRVYLYNQNSSDSIRGGQYVGTTVTNAAGQYSFTNLPVWQTATGTISRYYLSFVPPRGMDFTTQQAAGVEADRDSDSDSKGYVSVPLTFASRVKSNIGVGFVAMGGVRGVAWDDDDQDGVKQEDDLELSNVVVTLYKGENEFIDSTVTDSDGNSLINRDSQIRNPLTSSILGPLPDFVNRYHFR